MIHKHIDNDNSGEVGTHVGSGDAKVGARKDGWKVRGNKDILRVKTRC